MKKWKRPKLIVLVRDVTKENVLQVCKTSTIGDKPGGPNSRSCFKILWYNGLRCSDKPPMTPPDAKTYNELCAGISSNCYEWGKGPSCSCYQLVSS